MVSDHYFGTWPRFVPGLDPLVGLLGLVFGAGRFGLGCMETSLVHIDQVANKHHPFRLPFAGD